MVNWWPWDVSDNTLRAFRVEDGQQVLFQGSHNDWVIDTIFGTEGKYLVSVGRDQTAKLTEVATERFVDNITSITPGALRGGIQSVTRHPLRNEILIEQRMAPLKSTAWCARPSV